MTAETRILALDAALCACEGTDVPSYALNELQEWLELHFQRKYPSIADEAFASIQHDAVISLADNPQTYGA